MFLPDEFKFWFFTLMGILGLVAGSFVSSLSWEVAKANFSWSKLWRHSKCPKCNVSLARSDMIPLLSFSLLSGKCRNCKKPISIRYPLLELSLFFVFILIGFVYLTNMGVIALYREWLGFWSLPFFLLLIVGLVAIVAVDLEYQMIPDTVVMPLVLTTFLILFIFSPSPVLFEHLFWAAAISVFFLALHVGTRGRGMGLGDIKLAFLIGLILGQSGWVAIFLSFLIGAIIGISMVITNKARFGKPIPFGPFLVLGTFLVLLWGDVFERMISGGVI